MALSLWSSFTALSCCIQVQNCVTSSAWQFGQKPLFQNEKEQTDPYFPERAVLNTAKWQNQPEIQPDVSQTYTKKLLV